MRIRDLGEEKKCPKMKDCKYSSEGSIVCMTPSYAGCYFYKENDKGGRK